MFRAAQIAATGMSAQQLNVEVISNNVANLNTTGYKRRVADFQDLLYQVQGNAAGVQSTVGGNLPPVGSSVGLGVKNSGIFVNTTQGSLVQTNKDYDLAIDGTGYFQLTDANGNIYYTRAGRFGVNANGEIVDPQGFTVEGPSAVTEGITDVTINSQGQVFGDDGTENPVDLNRFTLYSFLNEGGLKPIGNNMFTVTDASGEAVQSNPGEEGFGTLKQGFIEISNVDAVLEITTLITAQRAYELNSRVISSADDMLNAINQIR